MKLYLAESPDDFDGHGPEPIGVFSTPESALKIAIEETGDDYAGHRIADWGPRGLKIEAVIAIPGLTDSGAWTTIYTLTPMTLDSVLN